MERYRKNPHLRGFVFLIEAQEHAEAGRTAEALDALERALAEGCRYPREWLEGDPRLAALRTLPDTSSSPSGRQRDTRRTPQPQSRISCRDPRRSP